MPEPALSAVALEIEVARAEILAHDERRRLVGRHLTRDDEVPRHDQGLAAVERQVAIIYHKRICNNCTGFKQKRSTG